MPAVDDSAASGATGGSTAQRERRRRILDATLALASKGGYDAVQMRTVAEKADVAVGTCTATSVEGPPARHRAVARVRARRARVDRSQLAGETGVERLRTVLDMITFAMQRDPLLTEAMTRAFMFADASATAEVDNVAGTIDRLFAGAIVGAEREPDEGGSRHRPRHRRRVDVEPRPVADPPRIGDRRHQPDGADRPTSPEGPRGLSRTVRRRPTVRRPDRGRSSATSA